MLRTATTSACGVFLVCSLLVGNAFAAQTGTGSGSKITRQVTRATGPIEIDGRLDEAAWSTALALELPYDTRPGDNTPAPVSTTCFLTYDDKHVYLGCRALDPDPDQIRARLSDRDRAFNDDFIGMIIDTFNDERQAYEFFVNPLGVQMDLTQDDVNGNEDESWDAIWDSAGQLTDSGYETEMAIPFSSLRFQSGGEDQTWGLDVVRFWPREHRYRLALNRLDRDVSCYLCQASKVTGFAGAEPGKNLEVNPTFVAGYTEAIDRANPTGGFATDNDDYEVGVTVKWGFTPSLTLNGTINPDFSQVEADVARIVINEPFALFFPEKRPFFLEGADVFTTPINAVYTRNVANPSWGAKITGKQNRHSIGVFAAQDEETTLLFPSSQGSSITRFPDEESLAGVVRYRLDVGKNSAVGALVTARDGDSAYHNYVYGIDAVVRPTESDTLRVQVLGSTTEYDPMAGEFDGRAFYANYNHNTTNWSARGSYRDFDEDFRADMGFITRVDFTMAILGGQYRWYGDDDAWFSRLTVGGDWDETKEQDGTLIERETEVFTWFQAAKQSFGFIGGGFRDRQFNGVEREETFVNLEGNFWPTKDISIEIGGGVSDRFDFSFAPDPAPGLALARAGDELRWGLDFGYNIGRRVKVNLSHDYRELDLPAGSPGQAPSGMPITVQGKVFEANVTEARVVYQFNVRTFLRLITQFGRVDFDESPGFGAPAIENKDWFNQFLFSYKLDPRTVLFVGYTDNRANQIDPFDPTRMIQTDRTLYAKVGYAWVP